MRSAATSNDYATTGDVLCEVLAEYHKRGVDFEHLACLYPTAPFVTADKLKTAMALMLERNADSVIPVIQYSFPPQRCNVIRNGLLEMKWPENFRVRSQDLEPLYHESGQFYIAKAGAFLKYRRFLTPKTCPMILQETEAQDIDNESDWKIAEIKYQFMRSKGRDIAAGDL